MEERGSWRRFGAMLPITGLARVTWPLLVVLQSTKPNDFVNAGFRLIQELKPGIVGQSMSFITIDESATLSDTA